MSKISKSIFTIYISLAVVSLVVAGVCLITPKAQALTGPNKAEINKVTDTNENLILKVNTHGRTLLSYWEEDPLTDGLEFNCGADCSRFRFNTVTDDPEQLYFGLESRDGSGWYYLWTPETAQDVFAGVFIDGRTLPAFTPMYPEKNEYTVEFFYPPQAPPEEGALVRVTFDAAGGTWAENESNTARIVNEHYWQEFIPPADPVKDGKTFIGWFDADGEASRLDFVRFWDPKFTAKWQGTIKYDANGGTGEAEDDVFIEGDTVVLNDGAGFSKDEKAPLGWNTQADGSGDTYTLGETIEAQDTMTLYAQWPASPQPTPDPEPTPTPGEQVNATAQTGDSTAALSLAILAATCAIALVASRKRA